MQQQRIQRVSPISDTLRNNKPTADQVMKLIAIIVIFALYGCAAAGKSIEDNAAAKTESTVAAAATSKQQEAMRKEIDAYRRLDGKCAELLQKAYDKYGYHEDRTRTGTSDWITLYRWSSAGYSLRLTASQNNSMCESFESIGSQLEK